jgi:hypothetical protein
MSTGVQVVRFSHPPDWTGGRAACNPVHGKDSETRGMRALGTPGNAGSQSEQAYSDACTLWRRHEFSIESAICTQLTAPIA